jgi:hypothetical protein
MVLGALTATAQLLPLAGVLGNAAHGTYEDCILNHMKGVQSDIAAQAILDACRKKFAESDSAESSAFPTSRPAQALPNHAITQIGGELLQEFGGELEFRLRNGTPDWNISRVTLGLQFWDPTRAAARVEQQLHIFPDEATLLPKQWGELRFTNPAPDPRVLLERWWIESASGTRIPPLRSAR